MTKDVETVLLKENKILKEKLELYHNKIKELEKLIIKKDIIVKTSKSIQNNIHMKVIMSDDRGW